MYGHMHKRVERHGIRSSHRLRNTTIGNGVSKYSAVLFNMADPQHSIGSAADTLVTFLFPDYLSVFLQLNYESLFCCSIKYIKHYW